MEQNHTPVYGLLGERLGHSFSPEIHRQLGGYDYRLFEKRPEQLDSFLRSHEFDGLNVTIPYKKAVIPYCQELTDQARRIGSVNTILRRPDGTLLGHNTDYEGFRYMLEKAGARIKGRKALVLGSGGASLTVRAALADLGVGEMVTISRSGPDNYENLERHKDAQIIVNATPVGMYPNNEGCPVDLEQFPQCEEVFDLIYNPARTRLLLAAQQRGLVWANGLGMLVAQARGSAEMFLNAKIPDERVDEVVRAMEGKAKNLILIGMPGCGKSTVGQALARRLGRPLVDLDEEIVREAGTSIPEIFACQGEEVFRNIEHRLLLKAAQQSGAVIATGGGIVTRKENMDPMRQNSVVIFLRRELDLLPREGRPLSQRDGLEKLYRQRLPLYKKVADIAVDNVVVEETASEIIRRVL